MSLKQCINCTKIVPGGNDICDKCGGNSFRAYDPKAKVKIKDIIKAHEEEKIKRDEKANLGTNTFIDYEVADKAELQTSGKGKSSKSDKKEEKVEVKDEKKSDVKEDKKEDKKDK